jgi:hypothetical protein
MPLAADGATAQAPPPGMLPARQRAGPTPPRRRDNEPVAARIDPGMTTNQDLDSV